MRLKREIEEENRELSAENYKLKQTQIPAGYVKRTCPNCGVVVLIIQGAYDRRLEKDRTFYCPVGHSYSFKA